MARTLTTAVSNHLATNDIRPIHLLSIGFSTPVNLTDNSFDLTSSISGSSKTYTASPFLISIPEFEEQTDVKAPGMPSNIVFFSLKIFLILNFSGSLFIS